jgi:geranylgeranyl reductase family protein
MKETDIAVVGGGPAGLLAAKAAAEKGKAVTLYESKEQIGFHEHCAGLLSIEGLEKLNLKNLPNEVVQNSKIKGAKIYSPTGQLISVSKKEPTAFVVDRSKFNQFLLQKAVDQEVSIKTSARVMGIDRDKDILTLKLGMKANSDEIRCKIAILAEGRFPRLNHQVNLPSPSRKSIVFSSMYIMDNVKDIDSEFVELYQDQNYAPGFFTWIIPIDESKAKVGLASSKVPASHYLDSFIKNHPVASKKLEKAAISKKMSGAIPLGSFIKKTYTDNILVVGDAAGHTKPTTGGGVIFGGIAANIAGKISSEAISIGKYKSKHLSSYQKQWKNEFKLNLKVMKIVRTYINTLTSKDLEKLFIQLNKQGMRNKISKLGDVDNQKTIVFNLIVNPKLWPILLTTGMKLLIKK